MASPKNQQLFGIREIHSPGPKAEIELAKTLQVKATLSLICGKLVSSLFMASMATPSRRGHLTKTKSAGSRTQTFCPSICRVLGS